MRKEIDSLFTMKQSLIHQRLNIFRMKRRYFLFSVFCAFLVLMSYTQIKAGTPLSDPIITTYTVLSDGSYLNWKVAKIGGQHDGQIKFSSGTITLTDSFLTNASFTIDMNSISCIDIEDKEKNQRLVSHLKSTDFFDVENYPTSTFTTTDIVRYGKLKEDGPEVYKLKGEMTIKGITKPVKLKAKVYLYTGASISAIAKFEIDRSEFDIQYGSGSFFENLGDKLIEDEIDMYVSLVAQK